MKRVLVTGASGFIGRQCIAPLRARGFDVHAIAHHAATGPGAGPEERSGARRGNQQVRHAGPAGAASEDRRGMDNVTWHRCDLLTEDVTPIVHAVAPTHLLHLAWYAVPGKYWTSRENLRWVRASLVLYDAFVASGGTRVVMAGSCAEYDWSGGVCRERDTPLAPRTYYGQCKRALGELILADATHAGVSAAWARFFFLFGPHEYRERLIASVIRALLNGETAKCSPGLQRRDFLHVTDAAAAAIALLDSDVQGAINIGAGAAISVRELVEKAAQIIGTGAVAFGALPADPDPLVVADATRLHDEVGYTAASDLDERLRSTIAWWRDQG